MMPGIFKIIDVHKIRVSRFLLVAILITFFSLAYIYQQVEIYCFAYKGQRQSKIYYSLLDKNNILRYNKNVITSLPSIQNRLLAKADFRMPETIKLVKTQAAKEDIFIHKITNKIASIFNVFSLRSQAEAHTLGSKSK